MNTVKCLIVKGPQREQRKLTLRTSFGRTYEFSEEGAFLHAKTQAEKLFTNRKNTNKGAVQL